ncbi:MAG: hypothetical protein KBS66_05105 [Eubacterium sp.]|nr:hypothetical protein [Candidatus Colimonas fimequi]
MAKREIVGMLLRCPHGDCKEQGTYVVNDDALVTIFPVSGEEEALKFADIMASTGYDSIEMCPDFIADEFEKIRKVVGGRCKVGQVKFCYCALASDYLLD